MLKKIPFEFATYSMIIILSGVMIFHILVLLQVIPFTIVWGGKLKTLSEMYVFEMVSIIINTFIIGIVTIKAKYINLPISIKIVNGVLYLFMGIMIINTIGNLFAEQSLETIIFTPMTGISALLLARIASEKRLI